MILFIMSESFSIGNAVEHRENREMGSTDKRRAGLEVKRR